MLIPLLVIGYDDCNATINAFVCIDADEDGYSTAGSNGCIKSGIDCNDQNQEIRPGASDVCEIISFLAVQLFFLFFS